MTPIACFFLLTAARSPQFLRIPLGSEWGPAWLRRANQPEHFAQRRAIGLPCLAGAAPHIAEQSGNDCVLLRAAQQGRPPALPARRPAGSAGGARGARTRSRSRTRSQHSVACFGAGPRCIHNADMAKLDINFRRMIRSVVGAPDGICWEDPWHEILHIWNQRVREVVGAYHMKT